MFECNPEILRRDGLKRDGMCRRLASAHAYNFPEGLTIVAGLEILIWSADTGNQFLDKARVLRHVAYSANRLWGGIFKKDPGLRNRLRESALLWFFPGRRRSTLRGLDPRRWQ